jgi:phage FluMu protein Com
MVNAPRYWSWYEFNKTFEKQVSHNLFGSALALAALAEWKTERKQHINRTTLHEVLVQCPKCKTVETLESTEDGLIQSRKFSQKDGGIFHDCGSERPCRIYRTS